MGSQDKVPAQRDNEIVLEVTCIKKGHEGHGWSNLLVTKVNNEIRLDPHVTGACVIVLPEKAATTLFDVLGEWLG